MSSSKGLPFFPVWVDDSIRMVTIPGEHAAVTGARFNLWVVAASGELGQVGYLPDNDAILQPLSHLSPAEWKSLKPAVVRSWDLEDGHFVINRLIRERAKQAEKSEKARQSAAARVAGGGYERRADAQRTHSERSAIAMLPPLPSPPLPNPTLPREEKTSPPHTQSPPPSKTAAADAAGAREDFQRFWRAYPNRKGKPVAWKAWRRHRPPIDAVLGALAWQVQSEQWRRGVIPNPATWINQHRWEDEPARQPTNEPKGWEAMREYLAEREGTCSPS